MSKSKGIGGGPGLLLFGLAVVLVITIFYFISIMPVIDNVVAIKAQSQLYLQLDDRGSALASFLQTEVSEINYAEILGDLSVKNPPAGIDSDLKKTLNKIDAEIELYRDDELVWNHKEMPDYSVSADVALPGMKKGEVKAS